MTLTKEQIEQAAKIKYPTEINPLSNAVWIASAEWAQSKLQPLIDAQDEYIKALEENSSMLTLWFDIAVKLRKKIEEAKNGI